MRGGANIQTTRTAFKTEENGEKKRREMETQDRLKGYTKKNTLFYLALKKGNKEGEDGVFKNPPTDLKAEI